MPARRSIIGRSLAGYLAAMCIVCSLPTSLAQVEGRKCVCTSKACKEAGVDTCKTRFFCYTERILTARQEIGESTVTRGCTEGATPLLCETKSWVTRSRSVNAVEPPAGPRVVVPWLKLKCCDNRDYCNADDDDDDEDDDDGANANTRKRTQTERTRLDATSTMQSDRKYDDSAKSVDRLLRDRVRALHIAALVLAIAALISVLASCYVVTRFLKNNRYAMNAVNYL
ncbi:Activin types I and II receptor domain-containing protein [Camponotus japonicus]